MTARDTITSGARALPAERTCACADALATAIVTPMELVPETVKRDLAPILSRREAGARRQGAVAR